jgi:signal transduction histidine kinase
MNAGAMNSWFSRSIGRKLLASFVGIFFLTYLLTAVFVYTSVRASMQQSEVQSLTQLANQKLELITNELQGVATNLHAWSQLEVMNDIVSGDVDKRVARTLANLKKQYGLAGEIYAFDFQNKLIASSDTEQATGGISLPPQWAAAGDGVNFIDKHDNPLGSGQGVAMSIVMHASFSPDFKVGVLVVTAPWPSIEKLLAEHSHRIVVYKDEIPFMLYAGSGAGPLSVDELGTLAARPADLELGATRYVAGYSENYHQLFNDWHMAALKEASIAYQPISEVALKLVGLGLLLAIPIVLAIRWLSGKLTGPVESLTRVVSGITDSGDLSVRAKIESHDELGTLAMAFNAMAENLQNTSQEREHFVAELEQLNKTLEQRVHDRTEALESANSELTSALDHLKAAQGQLVHSEKMASLGQLVAGVAHELNNPIGFIYANFPHLEEYTNDLFELVEVMRNVRMDEAQKAAIEQKIKQVDLDFIKEDILKIIRSGKSGASRIKEIVSSLRSFSRLDEAELKSVLLEDGLNDTLAILNHNIKGRITVEKDYRLNQPVMCLAGQINQVFMNILYNAIQAIEKEGTIRIVTYADWDFAVVSIADSGKGIPPDVIGKIFDPFFTTKKVGEGTGLGLSISYGIVEKHGGHIEVKSEVGKGTEFTICLRMRPEQAAPLPEGAS